MKSVISVRLMNVATQNILIKLSKFSICSFITETCNIIYTFKMKSFFLKGAFTYTAVIFYFILFTAASIAAQQCTNNATCTEIEDSFCSPEKLECVCESGYQAEDGDWCLSLIGQPCTDDKKCIDSKEGYSYCVSSATNRVCGCQNDRVENNDLTKCLRIVNRLEEACDEDTQCQSGTPGKLSICSKNVCLCGDTAVAGPGNPSDDTYHKCIPKAEKVGDSCILSQQCIINLGPSSCASGVCLCNTGYVSSPDGSRCLQKGNIGTRCQYDVECASDVGDNLVCTNGVCRCAAGYDNIPGENKCYKAMLIGQPCDVSIQCPQPNADCDNKICKCSSNYIPKNDNTTCLQVLPNLGDHCQESEQCKQIVPGKTDCLPTLDPNVKQCGCTDKYVKAQLIPNTCLDIVPEINLPCTDPAQCNAATALGTSAGCVDGVCQCRPAHGYHKGKCYIPARLEEPCSAIEQCYVGINELTMCYRTSPNEHKRCKCLPGAIPFGSNNKCYDTNKKLGANCTSNEECTISIIGFVNCESNTKTCSCSQGQIQKTDKMCADGVSAVSISKFVIPILIALILVS